MPPKPAATIREEISLKELADLCNLTERRVNQLSDAGVFVKLGRGLFRRSGVAGAYADYRVKSEMDRRSDGATSRDQFEAERARKLKMENDRREGLLIETPEALAALDVMVGDLRTALSAIPSRYTGDVGERRRLEDEIDKALGQLAEKWQQIGDDLQAGRAVGDTDAEDDA